MMRREHDQAASREGRDREDGSETRGFRVLLGAGAVIYALLGVAGLLFTGALHGVLGPDVQAGVPGFLGMARVFGALSLVVGVGYVVAAIDPLRNRGLLFVLFLVPLLMGTASIIGAAKSELGSAKGALFAGLNLAYVLLYFRLYPKPAVPQEARSRGGTPSPPERAEGDDEDQPSDGDSA